MLPPRGLCSLTRRTSLRYPAVPLETVLALRARSEWTTGVGEANVAHSVLSTSSSAQHSVGSSRTLSSQVKFATVVAMDLPASVTVTASDLGFGGPGNASSMLVWDGRRGAATVAVQPSFTLTACTKVPIRH